MEVLIGSIIFVIGYIGIATEHKLGASKSAIALATGGILWLIAAVASHDHHARESIVHAGGEIFEIVVFLLAAMSLVEILVHYKFFDVIRGKLYKLGLNDQKQFLIITIISFFLSAVLDNLTTTIVMIQIARRFFKGQNLLVTAAAIVIAANAGGAWSPIGDVTTIMLWIANKFNSLQIITQGFFPSLAIYLVSTALLYPKIVPTIKNDEKEEVVTSLDRSEKTVIGMTFFSFALPLIMNTVFDLPPYLGLLIGLGLVWLVVDAYKRLRPNPTHLEANIDELVRKSDIASIKFFIGILLAVSALHSLGILDRLSDILYGNNPEAFRVITGSVGLGLISSILDNVPLAAIAIQILETTDVSHWVLLALTLGTGGSLLIIGSAAGVVAMGMIKELTFSKYLQIGTVPAFVGFLAGVGVWLVQYYVL